MIIPSEILTKYHMAAISNYASEHDFYTTFLQQTDHIPAKLVEGVIGTQECVEELKYRKFARQELAKINGENIPEEIPNKTLEERATANENIAGALLGGSRNDLQVAEQHNKAIQLFAQTLTEDEALEIATVYPTYAVGVFYKADTFMTYGVNSVGDPQLYKVVQEHTSQEDWTPDKTPALYTPIGLTDDGYPVWSKPTGAHDAYGIGDIVDYNGTLYKSLIDGNVYSPDEYPAGWEVYEEV